jgi:hypothetical protein
MAEQFARRFRERENEPHYASLEDKAALAVWTTGTDLPFVNLS